MSINVYNIEQAILDKMNSSSTELELLEYSKMLTQLKTGIVQVVDTYASLPSASSSVGHLYYVQDEKTVYWANAANGWITLETQSLNILYQWGSNNFGGQLGNFTISASSDTSSPKSYYQEYNWSIVKGFSQDFSAIKTDGTLWSWGCAINYGVHGDNISFVCCRSSPVQEITSSTNWCDIGISSGHRSAIKTDGTLWGWGDYTGTGEGTAINRSSPVQEFCSASNWCKVEVKGQVNDIGLGTAAIKTDGTLWVWGIAQYSTTWRLPIYLGNSFSPIQEVSSSTNWSKVATDVNNAIKTDGTLWSWGYGGQGNLGNNTTSIAYASSPIQEITSSTNWCDVSSGVAIKTDGTLWSWGNNSKGQLGVNSNTSYSSPIQEITSSTDWITVQGVLSKHAIKIDGTLWSWGEGVDGILANNCVSNQSSPIQEITSSTNWCYAQTSYGTYRTGIGIQYITL